MPQKKTKVIREIPENPFIQGQAKRKKLRVAAYCRVSTEQEEQESSFENQVVSAGDGNKERIKTDVNIKNQGGHLTWQRLFR